MKFQYGYTYPREFYGAASIMEVKSEPLKQRIVHKVRRVLNIIGIILCLLIYAAAQVFSVAHGGATTTVIIMPRLGR